MFSCDESKFLQLYPFTDDHATTYESDLTLAIPVQWPNDAVSDSVPVTAGWTSIAVEGSPRPAVLFGG